VLLLRAGSRVLVLGDSPAGLRTLCDISDPEEVDRVLSTLSTSSPGSISRGFSQLLGNFQKDHEQTDSQGGPHQVHDLTARARDRVGNLLGRIRMHTEGRAAP